MSKDNQSNVNVPEHVAMESALGSALLLATKAPTHKYLFSHDFEWLIIPPIASRQFSLFRNKQNEPIAFVSWANVNADVESRLQSGILRLSPQDWNSGDKLYIIDIISPFVAVAEILKQLSNGQFKDQSVSILRPNPDQSGMMESISIAQAVADLEKAGNQDQK